MEEYNNSEDETLCIQIASLSCVQQPLNNIIAKMCKIFSKNRILNQTTILKWKFNPDNEP